jgi:hypothetical protein
MSSETCPPTSVSDLARLCQRVLDLANKHPLDLTAALKTSDQYWSLAVGDAFDLVDSPTLLCGSLAEDLQELRDSVEAEEERVLWHELDHAASILRFIAFSLLQPTDSTRKTS